MDVNVTASNKLNSTNVLLKSVLKSELKSEPMLAKDNMNAIGEKTSHEIVLSMRRNQRIRNKLNPTNVPLKSVLKSEQMLAKDNMNAIGEVVT